MWAQIAFFLLLVCSGCRSRAVVPAGHPLRGKWRYSGCLIKNTSVRGTVTFRSDGTFRLDAVARDDCPVRPIRGVYNYSLQGNRLLTDYKHGYGIAEYWFVKGDHLYLAVRPLTNVETGWSGGREIGNWRYRLDRE